MESPELRAVAMQRSSQCRKDLASAPAQKKTPGSVWNRALRPSAASAAQIRTTLNSAPLIETAAIAERKALAKSRMAVPLLVDVSMTSGEGADGVSHKIVQLRNL